MLRAGALAPLVHYVDAACGNPAAVFGPRASSLLDRGALIPVADAGLAFERAALALGEPDLGVRLGDARAPRRSALSHM
jgi:hypothetical protein